MIITVDGLDGVGKSTLARKLSLELGFEYVDKPLYELFHVKGDDNYLYKEISHIQKLVYDENDSNILKSYFTGLSLLYIKECMSNKNLIIDRGLLSAYAFNGDDESNQVFELLIDLGVFFDASILLTVSNEERIRRMKKRDENDSDLYVDKILNLKYDSLKNFILEHPQLNICIINTNNKDENQVFEEAMAFIQTMNKKSSKTKVLRKEKLD